MCWRRREKERRRKKEKERERERERGKPLFSVLLLPLLHIRISSREGLRHFCCVSLATHSSPTHQPPDREGERERKEKHVDQ